MFVVHMVGNAHVDPVWMWPWQAGVDEALATLAAAADRCDEYPEFAFTRGEAWLYRQAERLRPELFERIRRLVAAGRWFVAGGTWVQPDLNLPTWESLRRQIVHGQAYFRDRFGVAPRIGYNVDSFGQPAYLPDLLAAHGYTGYVFGRPLPAQVRLPFAAFRWRGAGGAELPAFRVIPGYAFSQADLRDHIEAALEHADPALGHTMCFYGVGDHGGGPTRAQLDWILAHRHALPGVELRLSTPAAFFDAIAPHRERLPVVEGELQHCFVGCYSVMGEIKRGQRGAEHRLEQAERAVGAFAADGGERAAYRARLDAAWPDVLFTAFHDILGGTATPAAWADCRAMQERARLAAEEVLLDVTRRWSRRALVPCGEQRIVAVNTDEAAFEGIVECETWLDYDMWGDRYLADAEGVAVPYQRTQPDAMHRIPRLLFPARIGAGAAGVFHIRPGPAPAMPALPGRLEVSPHHIANDRLRVALGSHGVAALDLDGRALLAVPGVTLALRQDGTDAWGDGIDGFAEPVRVELGGGAWVVEEEGPLRASVRMEHRIGTSRLRWTLGLTRGEPALTMRLEINFDERHTLLQLALRLAGPPRRRTDGVAGGTIIRAPGPQEYPVQGWSRAELEGAALAVVTQDAFSLSCDGADWRWTLLRSPRMAWQGGDPPVYHGRNHYTDQGTHSFDFRLMTGAALADDTLHTAARRLGQKLVTFDVTEGMARPLP
jgi:alpha-mannosidase